MCKRLNNYVRSHKLLMKSQYGFRESSNSEDAILEFMDYAYDSIHSSEYLIAVYIDPSNAFDTVNQKVMLKKLKYIGARGNFFKWFKTNLSNQLYVAVSVLLSRFYSGTVEVIDGF